MNTITADCRRRFEEMMERHVNDLVLLEHSADDIACSDAMVAVTIGLLGSVVTTSGRLLELLHSVHTDASLKTPKTMLGKLLNHHGDNIDTITRGGKVLAPYLHRLYGGHDMLSVHGDNPFVVLCRQYGIPKGIVQTLRHLVADSFSKNGGVLPGSSFLDFTKADGSRGNLLDEWAKEFALGTDLTAQESYASLLSVRIQDMGAVGLISTMLTVYTKVIDHAKGRLPLSRIAVTQLKIIALLTAVIGSAGTGLVKTKGVPKINIPALAALSVETGRLLAMNNKSIKDIHRKNAELDFRLEQVKTQFGMVC